jgi:hypothetical protein
MRMRLLLCFAVGLIALPGATDVSAQDNSSLDSDIQILRADLRSGKTKIMANQMQLSDAEGKAFWPIYNDYDNELEKLNDERGEVLKGICKQLRHVDRRASTVTGRPEFRAQGKTD